MVSTAIEKRLAKLEKISRKTQRNRVFTLDDFYRNPPDMSQFYQGVTKCGQT